VNNNEKYITRCIELAKNGLGDVAPNPLVGCVIVHNGKIIGEGFHIKYGKEHAEVNAINSVIDKSLLKDSVLYVNLEPCSHFGKTPPCTNIILKYRIPEIVIGIVDPNPEVAGRGVRKLKNAGCNVVTGVMDKECRYMNRRFFTFMQKNRPYIILKWAQTIDGYIDIDRDSPKIKPGWITNEYLKILVHKWRSEESAIMVGTKTAYMDNPCLNVRDWSGSNPVRIVIDRNNSLPKNLNLFDHKIPTLVFTSKTNSVQNNLEYINLDFNNEIIQQILSELYKRGIQSLFVEGGRFLLNQLIELNMWDEARVLIGDKMFIKGVSAPNIHGTPTYSKSYIDDKLLIFNNFN